jgi:hypothetical protein
LILIVLILTAPMALAQNQSANSSTVELLSGQSLHGTLTNPAISIKTRLGDLQVPTSSVLTLVCQPPPHVIQTLTTRDGDVLVGRVEGTTVHLSKSDGTAIDVPLAEVSRIVAESQSAAATQPSSGVVYGLSGDKLAVVAPASVDFQTRWGLLTLSGEQVHQIVLWSKGQASQRIYLSDGSALSGMMTVPALTLRPSELGGTALTVPIGELSKIDFPTVHEPAPGGRLELVGGDILRGSLQGVLTIQTDYGDVAIPAEKIDQISPVADSPGDLSVAVADSGAVRGAPPETAITCRLDCGISLSVPAGMIAGYAKNAPASTGEDAAASGSPAAPKDGNVEARVVSLVNQLMATASNPRAVNPVQIVNQLVNLGTPAVEPLQKMQPGEPPYVQMQINNAIARIRAANPGN